MGFLINQDEFEEKQIKWLMNLHEITLTSYPPYSLRVRWYSA
jgi:hypothetical protein